MHVLNSLDNANLWAVTEQNLAQKKKKENWNPIGNKQKKYSQALMQLPRLFEY